MLCGAAGAGACGQTHDHRQGNVAAEHVAHFGRLVDQLVHTDGQKVVEHQLSNRTEAGCRAADGAADDGAFGNRGIAYTLGSELIEHAGADTEAAAECTDVFTEQDHSRVFAHPDGHCLADGFTVSHHLTHLSRTSALISEYTSTTALSSGA